MALDAQRIVGLLAHDHRRRVVAALVLAAEPVDTAALATAAGLELRACVDALDRLSNAELVVGGPDSWRLVDEHFVIAARVERVVEPSAFVDEPAEIARVLDTAFRDGRLQQMPTKRTKRLIVLDYLAQQFEIGAHYGETEVNDRLAVYHDDVAMLRRWLVDEQFMDRAAGNYWRCGGSV